MKIACIAYRDWAKKIYFTLSDTFDKKHEFLFIFDEYDKIENRILSFEPDIILWYGWSDLISNKLVEIFFCVMLHPSRLPKYRGGSPIQNQIINGETTSAVTLFKINNKIDEGDIIFQKDFSLEGQLDQIFERIIKIGAELSTKMIKNFTSLKLKKQDHSIATYFPRRNPRESEITINEIKTSTSLQLYNKIRALQDPYPNAYIVDKIGNKLYLTNAKLLDEKNSNNNR